MRSLTSTLVKWIVPLAFSVACSGGGQEPQLVVRPQSGPPGTSVTLAAFNLEPGEEVVFEEPMTETRQPVRVRDDGTARLEVVVKAPPGNNVTFYAKTESDSTNAPMMVGRFAVTGE